MGRKKEKDSIKVNFNLDREIAQRLRELAQFEGTNQSNFLEILVMRWDEGINPESKLNHLFKNRNIKDSELKQIDMEIKKVSDQITIFNDLKRLKLRKKPEALKIIKSKLLDNDIIAVENIAKMWQKKTGVSAVELIMEARDDIKSKGI